MEADEADQNEVAIKKIDSAFESNGIMLRTLRELKILRLLEHENLIGIQNILKPTSFEKFEDVYVVTELMDSDLA